MLWREVLHARADRTERRAVVTSAGTLETPSSPTLFGDGRPVASGVVVNERLAEGIPTVFSCDRVIKQDVARCPIEIKKKGTDGSRKIDVENPVHIALFEQPNPFMSPYDLKETVQSYLNLWGNGYAEIEWLQVATSANSGRRLEVRLWPLDASRMTAKLNSLNQLQYTYRMPDGKAKDWIFDPAKPPILHLRQNCVDGINGRSPIQVLREAMGTSIAADRFVSRMYGQGGHPRTALSTSQKLTVEAASRIRNDFETLTVGEHNWHRVVVLDHDLKPVPLVMPNRDAQFVELRKLGRDETCGIFRVAPHKVANMGAATNNNIEWQGIEHLGDCLMPNFVTWTDAIGRCLLRPMSFGTHYAQFNARGIVRGDFQSTNNSLHLMRQDGVISANDYLRLLDMDDVISEADGGNLYMVNGNMVPLRRDPAASLDMPEPPSGVSH